ncbi:MAG: ABC transporter permease subunit [Oscillospiraceae bacterium]|jgi:putative aldouronate transport system permease protein|nr:ABC transporter permease subunit [Oscillospiraceae bacterium]
MKEKLTMAVLRACIIATCVAAFIPALNPVQLSGLISKNASLFTNAVSYNSIGSNFVRALERGWVEQSSLSVTYIGALVAGLGIVILGAAFCLSLGNIKMQKLGVKLSFIAALVGMAGMAVLCAAYDMLTASPAPERINPAFPTGIAAFFVMFGLTLLPSIAAWVILPKPAVDAHYAIEPKYKLFLMILPFLVLITLFAYLPLWGWRVAFFDYTPGIDLTMNDWVGFKWLQFLFRNESTRAEIYQVLTNTLAMSGIGLATSWLPMMFAIFLSEMRSTKFRRRIQTLTTIPNFISWVLVYSIAFAIFSTEGFFNSMLSSMGLIEQGTNHLNSGEHIWLKMWLWGTWKGLGWSAIIYIASITSIDPQLYEAATVDGAGRFQKMWHVTVPGLMSTFFVLLLLGIANVLSNGMDQYMVFYVPANRTHIRVLDLYVYHLGLKEGDQVPLATLIGMLKTVISVTLLFVANKASKFLRGESIV